MLNLPLNLGDSSNWLIDWLIDLSVNIYDWYLQWKENQICDTSYEVLQERTLNRIAGIVYSSRTLKFTWRHPQDSAEGSQMPLWRISTQFTLPWQSFSLRIQSKSFFLMSCGRKWKKFHEEKKDWGGGKRGRNVLKKTMICYCCFWCCSWCHCLVFYLTGNGFTSARLFVIFEQISFYFFCSF